MRAMLRRRSHAPLILKKRLRDLAALLVLTAVVGAQPPAVEASNAKNAGPKKNISRRNTEKESAASRLMGKAWEVRVDASVKRGLSWLAEQQNKRGFWTGLVGHKSGNRYIRLRPLAEQQLAGTGHMGVTALCGMAFLAGGHLPRRGKYGDNVQKTVDAVLSCVQENGVITVAGSRMYSHAFATLFLAEVYGMSRDPRIKKGLERATHIIVDCQNEHGGWRYNPFSREADLSVTVCQVQALRAARNIGIQIPKSTIDRAVRYVKDSQVASGRDKGLFYYKIHGRGAFRKSRQYAINAAAVTSLISAGIYDKSLLAPALDFLAEEAADVADYSPHHFYFWYGNYYACQVFFHCDGVVAEGCFQRYYTQVRDHLLADQEQDGRWQNPQHQGPGDAFGTAVACIILQIPKQYLPIFQR